MPSPAFFISHATEDAPMARSLCDILEAAGKRCWIAPRDIPEGADWADEILAGIESCEAVVLLFTASANASTHVGREISCAASRGMLILPVRVEEVPLRGKFEFYLGDEQWIDALARPLDEHLRRVGEALIQRLEVPRSEAEKSESQAPWRPAKETILETLASDLREYRDLTFRMQASMCDAARVITRHDDANQVFVSAIVAYNEFGKAFIGRLPSYRASIRKYWGPELAEEFQEVYTFLETKVYRGCVFELNDVRVQLNELRNRPPDDEGTYAALDHEKEPRLRATRRVLAELSTRSDALLGRLEAAS